MKPVVNYKLSVVYILQSSCLNTHKLFFVALLVLACVSITKNTCMEQNSFRKLMYYFLLPIFSLFISLFSPTNTSHHLFLIKQIFLVTATLLPNFLLNLLSFSIFALASGYMFANV